VRSLDETVHLDQCPSLARVNDFGNLLHSVWAGYLTLPRGNSNDCVLSLRSDMVEASSSSDSDSTRRFVAGERLKCVGGKYKGDIVYFVARLPLMIKVRFEDGEVRRIWPRNVELFEPEVSTHVTIEILLSQLSASFRALDINAVDHETFLRVCEQVGRRAFI